MTRVFIGQNSFALKRAIRDSKAEFAKQYGELSVEIIDGEEAEYNQIVAAIESVPFLAEKKLVVVYELGTIKEANENIEGLIDKAETGNELIIVEPKIDKRGTYYKYLKKQADLTEFNEPDERELANWLTNEAKKMGAKLSFADAYYLVQRVGIGQELAANELKKLIDYDKDISRANIELLTEASPQTTIFNLLDAAFGGNSRKAMHIYEQQRIQGEEPLKIFGLIVWQMHLVAMIDAASSRSDAEIMKTSGLKPFTLNKTHSIAQRMGREQIRNTLAKLVELDRQLKTSSIDADDALKNLLISIS